MASDIQVKLKIISSEAERAIKDLNKAIEGTETGLEETESAGKIAAAALKRAADEIEADLKDTARAADALGQALGPELSAKADMTKIVGDLKAMGLTTDQIVTDADELAAALQRLETVGRTNVSAVTTSFDDVDAAVGRVRTTTDNTQSVVANFAGNAVQELPGVSAAMGPLNMAIGQFAEYATEGNIGFRNFIKAGLGLGAAGVALTIVGKAMDYFGERAEKAREQQEALNKAVGQMQEGKTREAAQTIVEQYDGLIDKANELGFTTDQVIRGIVGDYDFQADVSRRISQEVIRDYQGQVAGYTEAGFAIMGVGKEVQSAREEFNNQKDILGQNEERLSAVTEALGGVAKEQGTVTRALGASEAAQKAYNDELDRNIGLMDDILPDLYDYEESTYELAESVRDLKDKQAAANEVAKDAKATDDERWAALEAVRQGTIDAAKAAFESAADYAAQKGAVEGSKDQINLMIDELRRQKEQYPELAGEIDKYILKLGQIPATVTTTARVITGGDFSGAVAPGGRRATGGLTDRRPYIAGEDGPELIVPGGSGDQVFSAGQTSRMLAGAGGAGGQPIVVQFVMNDRVVQEMLVSANRLQGGAR